MEGIAKQKYIKIPLSDFLEYSSWQPAESYFRSLEKYFEKNNRLYNLDDQNCIVYVDDKNDAMIIGLHFGLRRLEYYDGFELSTIVLIGQERKRGRLTNIVFDNASGKGMTLKQFKNKSKKEVELQHINKKEIIKKKILTKKKLENAINNGTLTEINIGNNGYVNRQELAKFIKFRRV